MKAIVCVIAMLLLGGIVAGAQTAPNLVVSFSVDTTLPGSAAGSRTVPFTVTLLNKSGSKLSFMTMSCSWIDNFATSDSAYVIAGVPCDENGPTGVTLDPDHKISFSGLFYTRDPLSNVKGLHIGFVYIDPADLKGQGIRNFHGELMERRRLRKQLIWSQDPVIGK